MSHLQRASDDTEPLQTAWDEVLPEAVERDPDDRRTPPAGERVFALLAGPWDHQVESLERAEQELRDVIRAADRLQHIESQLARVQNAIKLARLDLEHLDKRRRDAIARAVNLVRDQPKMTRKRRVEEARQDAAEVYDENNERTKRLTRTRLLTSEREEKRLLEEQRELLRHPLATDPIAMHFIRQVEGAVAATLARDRTARTDALGDWIRLRGVDERIITILRRTEDPVVLPGQAFGEGPIHLVAARKLALVELRRGRHGVRVEDVDGDRRLVQVTPAADSPLGLTDGSLKQMFAAAKGVEQTLGVPPAKIICVSAWTDPPIELEGCIMCGPDHLRSIVDGLEDVNVSRDQMRQIARVLAALPIPVPEPVPLTSLEHLTTVQPEEVPDGIPAVRDLLVLAHERRSESY